MDGPNSEVDKRQSAWEGEKLEQLAKAKRSGGKLTVGKWMLLGPLPAPGGNGTRAFNENLGPEKSVDLNRKYAGGKIAWRKEPKLVDGKVFSLPTTVGATYFYRTLDTPGTRIVDVSLGSDDGIKVWLNGKQIVDFTHKNPKPYLLKPGPIALQTYGTDGHSGWVKFRNMQLRDLSK